MSNTRSTLKRRWIPRRDMGDQIVVGLNVNDPDKLRPTFKELSLAEYIDYWQRKLLILPKGPLPEHLPTLEEAQAQHKEEMRAKGITPSPIVRASAIESDEADDNPDFDSDEALERLREKYREVLERLIATPHWAGMQYVPRVKALAEELGMEPAVVASFLRENGELSALLKLSTGVPDTAPQGNRLTNAREKLEALKQVIANRNNVPINKKDAARAVAKLLTEEGRGTVHTDTVYQWLGKLSPQDHARFKITIKRPPRVRLYG